MAYNPGYVMQEQHPFNQGQYQPHQGHYPVGEQSRPTPGLNYQQPVQPQVVQGQFQTQPQYMQQPPYPPNQTLPYPSQNSSPQQYPSQPPFVPPESMHHPIQSPYAPQQAPSTSLQHAAGFQNVAYPTAQKKTPWVPNEKTKYTGPGIADKDTCDNDPEEKITPTAPKYDLVVSGYEKLGPQTPFKPPPSYEESLKEAAPAMIDAARVPGMSAEVARQALLQLVASECCWGKGAAMKMEIKDIQATCAYHYVLETFTEGRSTSFTHVPYKGEILDAPHVGPAPLPWDIPCNPKNLFKNEERKIPVPHTEVVRPCHLCQGRGYNRCRKCRGRCKVQCDTCAGKGKVQVSEEGETREEKCESCNGKGRKCCNICKGAGCVQCEVCKGYGSVKHFIQLTVSYTNRHDYYIMERTDLPDELIKDVQGDTIFSQTAPRVGPVENFFEQEINQKSKEMVSRHATSWLDQRVLQQKHYLKSVPVHECFFEYNEKMGRFWVYGHDRRVFTTDYPHTCCCCQCTIL